MLSCAKESNLKKGGCDCETRDEVVWLHQKNAVETRPKVVRGPQGPINLERRFNGLDLRQMRAPSPSCST